MNANSINVDDSRTACKKRQRIFWKGKESLFSKANELSEFAQVDVALIVRHPQEGFFTFANIDERFWPSGVVEALRQLTFESESLSFDDTGEIPIALEGLATLQLEQREENVKRPN